MRGRRGFTILELLVTLVLVSVVAAVTMPAYFGQPEVTLENASVLLARDLRAAQNRSAYLAEEADFVFLDNGDGYCVLDVTGAVIKNPATALDFDRRYSEDGVFYGVYVASVECGSDRTIRYNSRGRATEAARITLRFAGDERVVVVEKGSGTVTIVGSTSGWADNGY